MALWLATDKISEYKIWTAVLPTIAEFKATMPIHYPPALQDLLPPEAKKLLKAQNTKLNQDWKFVSSHYPKLEYDSYVYAWLLVCTRTFYFVSPIPGVKEPEDHEDRLTFSPYTVYFNHASEGCKVSRGPEGYSITTTRSHKKGEELFISYGPYSNDYLLTEYGFISAGANEPGGNKWDEVLLDEYVLHGLSTSKKDLLREKNFLGKYVLDKNDVCFRTQVALRLHLLPECEWFGFVGGHNKGTDHRQKLVNELLLKILTRFGRDVKNVMKQLQASEEGKESHRDLLMQRWQQIEDLLKAAIGRLQG